jgi:hypothetical protein
VEKNPHSFANNYINFLCEYEAICKTALARESGPQGGLFDEKMRVENLMRQWVAPAQVLNATVLSTGYQ